MKISRLVVNILIVCLLQGCKDKPAIGAHGGSEELSSTDSDLFPDKVKALYAKNFSVTYHGNYKIVNIQFQSEQRKIIFNQKLVLVQRGTPTPPASELNSAWVIEIPVKTIAANDDGEVMRLQSLGLTDNLIAMGGGDIYDSAMRKRWEDKKITSIGYSITHAPAPEVMLSLNPDVALLYSFDNDRLTVVNKFRELGVNAIPTFAWAEDSYLGKAEWIKFTSLFFNEEAKANTFFEGVEKKCLELTSLVKAAQKSVTACWLYFPSNESDWNAHRNDFVASYLTGVGVENVLKDNGPTHQVGITNEELIAKAKDADFWIVNSTTDQDWPPHNYLTIFKAYREDKIYHYQARTNYEHNAFDWYETAEVRPDLVIGDLVSIFYPELLPKHTLFFFDKVKLTKK
jgi:iron complex transport system substrate-binding protein